MDHGDSRIRVGIRGISGLLGSRLALAISKQPDMEVTLGVARNDPTLPRLLRLVDLLSARQMPPLARQLLLDERHADIRSINKRQSLCRFAPADQYALSKRCDIVVDATGPNVSVRFAQEYASSRVPVVLQAGEYPRGALIAPPLIEQREGNIWRQGDCILSGVVPVLACVADRLRRVELQVLMQFSEPLHDYPTDQRIQATYRRDDLAAQLEQEIGSILPESSADVTVLQVPALDYYTATLRLELRNPISGDELRRAFEDLPRVCVADATINSTYEIDHHLREPLRAVGADLAPIVIYGRSLSPIGSARSVHVKIQVTFYSRLIAVLPNIDAIRMLAGGVAPRDAMAATDRYLSITKPTQTMGAP